jgi:Putative Ig domain
MYLLATGKTFGGVDSLSSMSVAPVEPTLQSAASVGPLACSDEAARGTGDPGREQAFEPVILAAGAPFSISVPRQSLAPCDAASTLPLEARLSAGDPLPSWLHFDPSTGRFEGHAPMGTRRVDLIVVARDPRGGQVSTKITLLFS